MTRKMKKSMVDWVEEIPVGWEIKRFKLLFSLGKGLSITKADLVDDGIAVVSYGQIHSKQNTGTHLGQSLIRYIPGTYHPVASSLLKCGDIVFADTSEDYDGIGNAVLVDVEDIVFAGYHTIWARKKEPLNSKYFAYLFKSDIWRNQIRSKASGIKVFSITQKILNETSLLIPPIKEQRAIANYLDSLCNEIDSLSADIQKEIETLEAYRKSLITETVTKGLNKNAALKDSGYEYLGKIPERWNVYRLRFLGSCSNGISKAHVFFGTGYPFVSYGDVYNNFSLPVPSNLIETNELERRIYSVRKGDIFFTRTSETIEEIAFSSACIETINNATFAGFLIRFRPYTTSPLDTDYLKYYFRSDIHRKYFVKEMNLVTRASLSQTLLKNMPVIVPPLEEQKIIANYLNSKCAEIDSIISSKKQQLETLSAYKKSLIYEYVTGKKEVT